MQGGGHVRAHATASGAPCLAVLCDGSRGDRGQWVAERRRTAVHGCVIVRRSAWRRIYAAWGRLPAGGQCPCFSACLLDLWRAGQKRISGRRNKGRMRICRSEARWRLSGKGPKWHFQCYRQVV